MAKLIKNVQGLLDIQKKKKNCPTVLIPSQEQDNREISFLLVPKAVLLF